MFRPFVGVLALALLAAPTAADDKKDEKRTTWVRESNGIDLKFEMGKETMKGSVFSGQDGFIATCAIKADKDGVVHAKVTEVESKGNFPSVPKAGFEFSFKWKVDGDKAELSDLKGEGVEDAKAVVEGEYKKK
jgi:hypothetical protein